MMLWYAIFGSDTFTKSTGDTFTKSTGDTFTKDMVIVYKRKRVTVVNSSGMDVVHEEMTALFVLVGTVRPCTVYLPN